MENIFLRLLNMSLTAGILVVAVLLLRVVLHKAPRWIHVLLWALVAVRLLCPFTIESNLSLMPDTPAVSVPAPTPAPDTPPVENTVPDTPVVDSPTVIPPATEDPSVIPPVVDTPPMTVIPPATDTPVVTPTPESSVVTATPETVVTPWQMVLTVATYVWLAGVALLAAYAVFTTLRLRRQVGEAAHIADNLWQCDHLRSPFILGLFRPRIYLPSDLSAVARDSVVAHEQAHLRRRDHWWKPLGFVLLMVYWFNPLMWVAYVFLCRDIEAACDESVVRNMNAADRRAYSEALLSCSAPRRLVSACPLAFGETAVKSRIKSVLSYKKPTIWIIVAALLVSTVAGVCLLTNRPADKPDTDKPAVSDKDDDPDEEGDEPPAATAPVGLTYVTKARMSPSEQATIMGSESVKRFDTRAEFETFLTTYQTMESGGKRWEISDFDQFDTAFFADNALLMTFRQTSSGMFTPQVGGYTYSEDKAVLSVVIDELQPGGMVTMDIGYWLLFSGIRKTDLEGVTVLASCFGKEIPTSYYWKTYSHPVIVGDEGDVAFGCYNVYYAAMQTLLPLVEGLEWYSAEGGVDTGFSAIAYFTFDDGKKYYVSPDKKQLYNGERFANLTAEQSEQLDYYLREGNPGEDAIAASVTGTVTEWNKEGGYLMLEVTEGDLKLGPKVMVYTGILPPGSAPAVGYSATIYYDGWYDGNAIFAIDRKWADADLMGGPDITTTDESLYDALLQSIVDYYLWLIPSAQEPDCSLMIGQHADLSELGIQLMDLDKNGPKELLISAMDWPDGVTPFVYDVYTIKDGKLVHLLSSGERSRYYLRKDGYIEHQWAGGAAHSGTDFYRLVDGELTRLMRIAYDADYAVKCGLAADLSSVTEDVAWFRTVYASDGSEMGFGHITKQKMQDIITDFAADHPLLNVNFLCLETGVVGSPDDDPPTTGTTTPTTGSTTGITGTKPTTPTTKPTTTPTTPSQPETAPVGLTYIIRAGTSSNEEYEALYGTPIRRFDTRAELESFLIEFQTMGRGWKRWEISDFNQFDNAFFAQNSLLVTGWLTSSGMHTPQVAVYTYSEGGTALSVGVDELHPGFVTDDVGEWLLFSGIKKVDLQGVTELKAYLRKEIPTDSYMALLSKRTSNPQTVSEKWRKWIPGDEGWALSYIFAEIEKSDRWKAASGSSPLLEIVFNINGKTYYADRGFYELYSEDGSRRIALTADEYGLLQWVFAYLSEDSDNIWVARFSHPVQDFEYNYTSLQIINTAAMRAILERESWVKNSNYSRSYDAFITWRGVYYYVDWANRQIVSNGKVITLTEAEQKYLTPIICDTYWGTKAYVTGYVYESGAGYFVLKVDTQYVKALGDKVKVSLLRWTDAVPAVGSRVGISYDGYTYSYIYPCAIGEYLPEPAHDLEFWIGEFVGDVDFSNYQEKYGLFGGTEYYGTGYAPANNDPAMQVDPEHCVTYIVSSYPDEIDYGAHITSIRITDPNVKVYGISLKSSFDEFERALTQQGFTVEKQGSVARKATKGRFTITFTAEYIYISVATTNRYGIVY